MIENKLINCKQIEKSMKLQEINKERLSMKAGINKKTLRRIMNGDGRTKEVIISKLASALNCSVQDLLSSKTNYKIVNFKGLWRRCGTTNVIVNTAHCYNGRKNKNSVLVICSKSCIEFKDKSSEHNKSDMFELKEIAKEFEKREFKIYQFNNTPIKNIYYLFDEELSKVFKHNDFSNVLDLAFGEGKKHAAEVKFVQENLKKFNDELASQLELDSIFVDLSSKDILLERLYESLTKFSCFVSASSGVRKEIIDLRERSIFESRLIGMKIVKNNLEEENIENNKKILPSNVYTEISYDKKLDVNHNRILAESYHNSDLKEEYEEVNRSIMLLLNKF